MYKVILPIPLTKKASVLPLMMPTANGLLIVDIVMNVLFCSGPHSINKCFKKIASSQSNVKDSFLKSTVSSEHNKHHTMALQVPRSTDSAHAL